MHSLPLRAYINALAKMGIGSAIALALTQSFAAWMAALGLLAVVIDNLTAPVPEPPVDKLERELMLEQQITELEQQAILDKLTIDTLQRSLNTAMEANQALETTFQAWASQGDLQGAILAAAKQRIAPGA